jgi:hypothetical protein
MAVSKELAKNEIDKLFKKWFECSGNDFTEQDTITNFILPFIKILGWNIYNVNEVKQGGYPVKFRKAIPVENRALTKPDCIILLKGEPYMVLEFKRLNYGTVDRYESIVEDLLTKAEYLKTKYAILTRFIETAVYDGINRRRLSKFNRLEHLERFEELWQYLSRETAEQERDNNADLGF